MRGLLDEFAAGNGPERVTVLANRHVAAAFGGYARGPVALHELQAYRAGDGTATRALAMAGARLAPRRIARGVPSGVDVLHHPVTVPIPRLPGVPTVTTIHDSQHHDLPRFFSRAERAYRRWAYDGAARAADLVLTNSEYTRSRLLELVDVAPDRVEAVHLGIDHDRFNPTPTDADESLRRRLGLPERFLVYPANLWPHKNHARLIDALGVAREPDLHLLLSGQEYGRGGELAERARAAGVEDRVRHLGYLQPDDLPALLRAATAMVFPSLYEGFGSPPLEAMACGCPVACSPRGSLAEVVGGAALAFDPESVEATADAISRIASEGRLREGLRSQGLRRASGFSWSTAAGLHRSIYDRVAAASSLSTRP